MKWKNKGPREIGINDDTGKTIIKIDKKYYRAGEVDFLKGIFTKQKNFLNGNQVVKGSAGSVGQGASETLDEIDCFQDPFSIFK